MDEKKDHDEHQEEVDASRQFLKDALRQMRRGFATSQGAPQGKAQGKPDPAKREGDGAPRKPGPTNER